MHQPCQAIEAAEDGDMIGIGVGVCAGDVPRVLDFLANTGDT